MPNTPDDDAKGRALRQRGLLHPHPDRVQDELFDRDPFFDPRDLVQVKYEMLRHVRVDGMTVRDAADAAGLSRPTFYGARSAFDQEGLLGLFPKKKGPRRAHKLSEEVLDRVEAWRREDPSIGVAVLAARLREQLGLLVHPKSIARALARRAKKGGPE
ncbi:MAG: helix-turn-helix domain containing protein [Proteobacteria bacterium]|nr:helix-turn-helix domain containing protein [Pseudomonadota bacterium]